MIVGVVVGGAVVIAGIGFAGSYAAVRDLAIRKGFGTFAHVFPLGVDVGILVLLALDLLLTWLRMPFPILRQTAWLLTGATIAFNGAAAWPDPLGVGMHAVIPILFVVTVEAARHAIGQLARITAGRHMEPIRLVRWLLSPVPTFRLWRRMKLWELRSYDRVLALEQERLVYQARLRTRFGRAWRRRAPVEARLPLRLTRYGLPLNSDRTLASAPVSTSEGTALETHVADALALASPPDGAPARSMGEGMNDPSPRVNQGVGTGVILGAEHTTGSRPDAVNQATGREPGSVNRDAGQGVNPPIHAPADARVNRSRVNGSRPGVNATLDAVDSRVKPFTPTVNRSVVNRVNCVNPLVTGTVNGFTPIVKPREFTREAGTVNRPEWSVKQPVQLSVNRAADREQGGVNDGADTVNPAPDKAVNGHPRDREKERVNDADDRVNEGPVNSRRARRVHAAKQPAPSSVHAAVGAPSPEEKERAEAAAAYFAAKKADPSLTQKDFVRNLGRSPGWMTKALKEAAAREAEADG
ncbi:DUF2637 domain-containing protein [Streptomyces marianii]|uniref:DUF2637 domain-containing protein n=1 Tax=Streptomyces marianii TaxID=1817406 RepID=UPI001F473137|nr:DUF2637 domain-containing protein [Streptomyces marianii]